MSPLQRAREREKEERGGRGVLRLVGDYACVGMSMSGLCISVWAAAQKNRRRNRLHPMGEGLGVGGGRNCIGRDFLVYQFKGMYSYVFVCMYCMCRIPHCRRGGNDEKERQNRKWRSGRWKLKERSENSSVSPTREIFIIEPKKKL